MKLISGRLVLVAGAIAACTIIGGIMALPILLEERHAASERPRIQALVDAVVAAEIGRLNSGSGYVPIAFDASKLDIANAGIDRDTLADYAIVARDVSEDVFRIQAWPRPNALSHERAAGLSYFVELSIEGRILDQGWLPDEAVKGSK